MNTKRKLSNIHMLNKFDKDDYVEGSYGSWQSPIDGFARVLGIVQLVKTLGNTSFEREDEEVELCVNSFDKLI